MKNFKKLSYLIFAGALIVACEKKETKTEEAATTEVSAESVSTSFKIDTSKSEVHWLGKKVTGEHSGNVKVQSGELQTSGGELTGGTIVIDMNSITNKDIDDQEMNAKLIGHLKSDDFFGVEKNPIATLKITGIQPGEDGKKVITGDLTIKGTTKPVNFQSDVNVSDDKVKAKGTAVINRTDYDVRYGSKKFFEDIGDKMIYDEFELEFDIVAVK